MVKLGLTYRLSSTFILVAFHLTYGIPGCCVHVPRDEEQAEVGHPQEFQFLNSFFFFPDLLDPHNKLCTSDNANSYNMFSHLSKGQSPVTPLQDSRCQ